MQGWQRAERQKQEVEKEKTRRTPQEVLSYEEQIVFWFLTATLMLDSNRVMSFKTEILNLEFYIQPIDIYQMRTK